WRIPEYNIRIYFLKNMDLSKWRHAGKEELYWVIWCKVNEYVNQRYEGVPVSLRTARRNEMMKKAQVKYARRNLKNER
ncbi:MAG: hypothetical protein ACOCRX_09920, partial [Candidatus Woesearchaeota archaeon]